MGEAGSGYGSFSDFFDKCNKCVHSDWRIPTGEVEELNFVTDRIDSLVQLVQLGGKPYLEDVNVSSATLSDSRQRLKEIALKWGQQLRSMVNSPQELIDLVVKCTNQYPNKPQPSVIFFICLRVLQEEERLIKNTAVEYFCLFALHWDSYIPLVAEKAYEEDVEYFTQLRRLVNDPERLKGLILDYVQGHPNKVPPSVIFFTFQDVLDEEQWPDILKETPICWADLGSLNRYGQTVLMVAIKRQVKASTLGALLKLPDADLCGQVQDPKKATVAHYCARTNATELFNILSAFHWNNGGKFWDLSVKDDSGRTAAQLAASRDHHYLLRSFPSEELGMTKKIEPKLFEDFNDLLFSPASNCSRHCEKEKCDKCSTAADHLLAFMREQLPQLTNLTPSFIRIPHEFPAECPNADEGKKCGWEAEKKTFELVVDALRAVHESNSDLVIACFHSLRYGCTLNLTPSGHQVPDRQWESDIDLVVLCYDKSNGTYSGRFFEVKSHKHLKEILEDPKKNIKYDPSAVSSGSKSPAKDGSSKSWGLMQLCTHILGVKGQLDIADLSWVKVGLVTPRFPPPDPPPSKKPLKQSTQKTAVQKIEDADKFLDDVKDFDKCLQKLDAQLLNRLTLEDKEKLKEWLELHVLPGSSHVGVKDGFEQFLQLVAWCLMHCVGITIKEVSTSMDKTAEKTCVTLLTEEQNRAFSASSGSLASPTVINSGGTSAYPHSSAATKATLIIGGTGTGKSFIGVHKLLKLGEAKKLNENCRGLYVTAGHNIGLNALVKTQLAEAEHVDFKAIEAPQLVNGKVEDSLCLDALTKLWESLMSDTSGSKNYQFVVIDQLEDFHGFFSSPLFPAMMENVSLPAAGDPTVTKGLAMLWLLVNPSEVESPEDRAIICHFADASDDRFVVRLKERIRNTKEIGIVLDRVESFLPCMRKFAPEPMSQKGIHVLAEYYRKEDGPAEKLLILAKALRTIIVDYGVESEDILLISWDYIGFDANPGGLWKAEAAFIPMFTLTSKGGCPSMAPILIQAPVINLKRQLQEEDFHKAQEYFAKKFCDAYEAQLPNMKEELKQSLVETIMKLDSEIASAGASVLSATNIALQATAGLLRRYVQLGVICIEMKEGLAKYSVPNETEEFKHLEKEFKRLKKLSDKMGEELSKAFKSDKNECLKSLIARNRYLSVMNLRAVRGYEAKVVVIVDGLASQEHYVTSYLDVRFIHHFLSRAKVMAVMISREDQKFNFSKTLGEVHELNHKE